MEHTASLIWLALWPLIIYISYRFVRLNVNELERREKGE